MVLVLPSLYFFSWIFSTKKNKIEQKKVFHCKCRWRKRSKNIGCDDDDDCRLIFWLFVALLGSPKCFVFLITPKDDDERITIKVLRTLFIDLWFFVIYISFQTLVFGETEVSCSFSFFFFLFLSFLFFLFVLCGDDWTALRVKFFFFPTFFFSFFLCSPFFLYFFFLVL